MIQTIPAWITQLKPPTRFISQKEQYHRSSRPSFQVWHLFGLFDGRHQSQHFCKPSTQDPYVSSIVLPLKSTKIYQVDPLLSLETHSTRKANSAWSRSTSSPSARLRTSRTRLHGTQILLSEMTFLMINSPIPIGRTSKTQLLVLSFQTFSLPISGKTYLMEISAMKR